jgi:ribosome-associated protein
MTKDDSRGLAQEIIEWGLSKKAEDVVLLDVHGLSDVTDYFVLFTGSTQIQVQAIADAILDGAVASRRKPLHVEGRDLGRWALLDFVDVVVHVMQPEARSFYSLERLWGDAPIERFDENGELVTGSGNGSGGQESQA